jgi:hypothetical protein
VPFTTGYVGSRLLPPSCWGSLSAATASAPVLLVPAPFGSSTAAPAVSSAAAVVGDAVADPKSRCDDSTAREVAPFPATSAARIRLPLLCPAEPLLIPPATLLQTSSSLQLRSVCHLFCCSSPLFCCCLCRRVRPADVASSAPAAPPLKHRCSWEKHSGRPDGRPG